MKLTERRLAALLAVLVVAVAVAGAYAVLTFAAPSGTLPVVAGTTFTWNATMSWVAHFSVGPGGGRLVGAWTEYDGIGPVPFVVVNGTVPKPSPQPGMYMCPLERVFSRANGTVGEILAPGAYTVYWGTFCTHAEAIVVTQTLQVVAP